jgi:hypothetical protein
MVTRLLVAMVPGQKGTSMFWRKKKDEPQYEPPIELDAPIFRQPVAPEPEPSIPEQDWQGSVLLFTDDGSIAFRGNSVADAKLAIKQLRLRKKAVGLEKREVTQAITAINAERRMQTANQGSMVRGRGGVAQTMRAFQSISRDADKRNHAARLQPYQQEKARLDEYTLTIDQMITKLEAYILQHSD